MINNNFIKVLLSLFIFTSGCYDRNNVITTDEKGETDTFIKKDEKKVTNKITVTSISFDDTIHLYLDNNIVIRPVVLPENASDKTLLFSSSDESIVFIDETGLLVAKNTGEAYIEIVSKSNSNIRTRTKVIVENLPENALSLKLMINNTDAISQVLQINESIRINPIINTDYSNIIKKIEWISSNYDIANVSQNGTVTACGNGKAIITAKVETNIGKTEDSVIIYSYTTPKLIAHRGFNGFTTSGLYNNDNRLNTRAAENSLLSFKLAGEYGFSYCETDILMSSDGKFYCFHDLSVARTTNGTGNITSLNSSQVDNLIIDIGFNEYNYSDDGVSIDITSEAYHHIGRVPKFEEYLQICKEYNMTPIIELKGESFNSSTSIDIFNRLVTEAESIVGSNYKVISFDEYSCKKIKEIRPNIDVLFLTNTKITKSIINKYNSLNIGIAPSTYGLNTGDKELAKYAKIKNVKQNIWTVDSCESYYDNYINFPIDFVTTNCLINYNDPKMKSSLSSYNDTEIKFNDFKIGKIKQNIANPLENFDSFLDSNNKKYAISANYINNTKGINQYIIKYNIMQNKYKYNLLCFDAFGSLLKFNGFLQQKNNSLLTSNEELFRGCCKAALYITKTDGTDFTNEDLDEIKNNMSIKLISKRIDGSF